MRREQVFEGIQTPALETNVTAVKRT
jgi:hypothetical protein